MLNMQIFSEIIPAGSAAAGMAMLSLAVVLGLGLGAVRVRGIRLGVSGVLFSALIFGQLGLAVVCGGDELII